MKVVHSRTHNINNQTPINDAIYGLVFLAALSLNRVVVCIGGSQVGVNAGAKVVVGSSLCIHAKEYTVASGAAVMIEP